MCGTVQYTIITKDDSKSRDLSVFDNIKRSRPDMNMRKTPIEPAENFKFLTGSDVIV